jgi:hypothetical protein
MNGWIALVSRHLAGYTIDQNKRWPASTTLLEQYTMDSWEMHYDKQARNLIPLS